MDTKKLRQKILDLAIHGKLVPQDPNDEPASVLLERIRTEKERLVKEGKIKKSKASKTSDTPHYENVPFEVPSSWEWCKLGDLVSFLGGFAYKSNTYVSSSDWQVIRIGNIKNDNLILDSQPVFVSEEIGNSTRKYLIKTNDILFSMTGTKGKRDYFFSVVVPELNRNLLLNQRVGCLRKISKDIDIYFLCLVLKGQYVLDAIFSTETGNVSQGNIGSESTLNLNIALPPLPEQKRVVKEVKRWFALIDEIEQGKTDLQTIIKQTQSKILDLAIHGKLVRQDPNDEPAIELLKRINPNAEITCDNGQYGKVPEEWIMCTIGDLFDVVSAKRVLKSDWKNKGIPFYRAREIVQLHKEGIADKDLFITEELFAELKDKFGTPNVGDIMLSAVGSIGYTYIVNEKDSFYYKDASVLCLRNVNKLNSQYFSMLFETTFVKEQMHDNSKGTTVDTITIEKLKKYFVPLPPLAEQHRIVAKIEELFTSLDNIQKALEV
jgi:type I restriction enzyme S subunit